MSLQEKIFSVTCMLLCFSVSIQERRHAFCKVLLLHIQLHGSPADLHLVMFMLISLWERERGFLQPAFLFQAAVGLISSKKEL